MVVLGGISATERRILENADDKVQVLLRWVTKGLAIASCEKLLTISPPIFSRLYQEICNARLAYNNAYKVAAIPYPFPLAQMMHMMMCLFLFLMPILVERFTGAVFASPVLAFIVTTGFFALHLIASELENPFGNDANDLPLVEVHEGFND